MRSSAVAAALLAPLAVRAQNATYVSNLLQTLNSAGLTSLASTAEKIANTSVGQSLFSRLPNGTYTVFAPNNDAFKGVPSNVSSDVDTLAAIISYHVVPGSFQASDIPAAPSDLILRTAANDSKFVALEGGLGQVLALSKIDNTSQVIQQNTPVHVMSSMNVSNLVVHVVDSVIDFPPPLPLAIASHNLTMLAQSAQQAGLLDAVENTHGITIFAPTDDAFQKAIASLGGAQNVNETTLKNVLANHVINGTSAYSTQLLDGSSKFTSAGGQQFSVSSNSSGAFVTSGSSSAKIVEPDVLVANGVVHIIDTVLLNTNFDASAASSAVASATSNAAGQATQTGPVGTAKPASSSSGSSSHSAAVKVELGAQKAALALGVAAFGMFVGGLVVF